jgi:hypothetical protein
METMMEIAVIFAILNSVVLVFLIVLYGRIARKSKATYSLGLVVFAVFLLAQNLATIYSYVTMSNFFGLGALPYLSSISALEFVALVVLAKITF